MPRMAEIDAALRTMRASRPRDTPEANPVEWHRWRRRIDTLLDERLELMLLDRLDTDLGIWPSDSADKLTA